MRTKEQMYTDIRDWEMEAGEDFLDYFGGSLNEFNFMFWSLGKGYISEEQLRAYEQDSHYSGTSYLYGDEEYSVVNENDYENFDEGLEKAYRILADFFTSTKTYQIRVDHFLRNVTQVKFEEVLKYIGRIDKDKFYYELKGQEPVYIDMQTPLTIDIIKGAAWYQDDNN